MSYAYTLDPGANLLVVKFWGEIAHPEEAAAVLEPLSDPRIRPDPRILVDRTASSVGSTPQDARNQVDFVESKLKSFGRPRVAVVVSSDLDYGMIRMFESVSDGRLEHEFLVTRTVEEACEWLEVDPDRIDWPAPPA